MLLSHFILNLRSFYVAADPDTAETPSRLVISTVRFADDSLVGNMGAQLNAPWESEDDGQTMVFSHEDELSTYANEHHTSTFYEPGEASNEVKIA